MIHLFLSCGLSVRPEKDTASVGLLSIGLIADNDQTYYAKNAEYGDERAIPYSVIASSLKAWIEAFERPAIILSDESYLDWPLILHMFNTYGWPNNLMREPVQLFFDTERQQSHFRANIERAFALLHLRERHVLDHAIAIRFAYNVVTTPKSSGIKGHSFEN